MSTEGPSVKICGSTDHAKHGPTPGLVAVDRMIGAAELAIWGGGDLLLVV